MRGNIAMAAHAFFGKQRIAFPRTGEQR